MIETTPAVVAPAHDPLQLLESALGQSLEAAAEDVSRRHAAGLPAGRPGHGYGSTFEAAYDFRAWSLEGELAQLQHAERMATALAPRHELLVGPSSRAQDLAEKISKVERKLTILRSLGPALAARARCLELLRSAQSDVVTYERDVTAHALLRPPAGGLLGGEFGYLDSALRDAQRQRSTFFSAEADLERSLEGARDSVRDAHRQLVAWERSNPDLAQRLAEHGHEVAE
jgi:hypothetical protein